MTTDTDQLLLDLRALCEDQAKRLRAYEAAFATTADASGMVTTVSSVPGNAWDVLIQDRDEWKKKAIDADGRIADLARSYSQNLAIWVDRVHALEDQLVHANKKADAAEMFARQVQQLLKHANAHGA